MSDLAAQLIFHPSLSKSLKLWTTTVGRDKTYRTVQYASRFIAWFLLTRGNKDEAARFNALKAALGSGRKLMRLFKPLEHLQAALRAATVSAAPLEQFTTIGRQVGYFGYLSLDMVVWAQSIKVLRLTPETAKKVNLTSQRFWLAGIAFSIAHSLAKVRRLANETNRLRNAIPIPSEKPEIEAAERKLKIKALYKESASTNYQLVQDSLDIWFPITSLEFASANDGLMGLIGVITSIMALRLQWAKL